MPSSPPPSHTRSNAAVEQSESADVIIVGAGPAGLAAALSLAAHGRDVWVLDSSTKESLAEPADDGREIALTHRSRALLEVVGAWQHFPLSAVSPLHRAEIADGVRRPSLIFAAGKGSAEPLGWLVPNVVIRRVLFDLAVRNERIRLLPDSPVTGIESRCGGVEVHVESRATLRGELAVAADSRFSSMRRMAGIGARMLDFGRTCIVTRVGHDRDHDATAWELFRHGATLALLPLKGRRSSVVLTVPAHEAATWLSLDDAAFLSRVERLAQGLVGRMHTPERRHAYPLVATYADRFVSARLALVGDAAVGMHPVTAHGFNFGLYGVDALTRALSGLPALTDAQTLSVALSRFEREHRRATRLIYEATNAIVQFYCDERAIVRDLLRPAVLSIANRIAPVRRFVTAQLADRQSP
jgi:ubiquinone biosynthesis UbiH/UbiF/VisC/COQ6 family hydroxylase